MSDSPAVELTPAGPAEAPVISRLIQLYAYDFSDILDLDVGDDGLFAQKRPDAFWLDPRYRSFLIRAGGRLAGFVIVDSVSRLTGQPVWDMAEFFVLRRHRLAGVGARAAVAAFDAFRGTWEVREVARNAPAQAFWRKVIARYTGGRFIEVACDDEKWRGPVQRFENTGA
jgi:predicted acetyltransferase